MTAKDFSEGKEREEVVFEERETVVQCISEKVGVGMLGDAPGHHLSYCKHSTVDLEEKQTFDQVERVKAM